MSVMITITMERAKKEYPGAVEAWIRDGSDAEAEMYAHSFQVGGDGRLVVWEPIFYGVRPFTWDGREWLEPEVAADL